MDNILLIGIYRPLLGLSFTFLSVFILSFLKAILVDNLL